MSDRTVGPLRSSWRYAAAAAALSAGFACLVQVEQQYHAGVWWGPVFSAVTVAWFVLAVVLARRDIRAVWLSAAGVAVTSVLISLVGLVQVPAAGTVGRVSALVRLSAAALVLLAAVVTLTRSDTRRPGPRRSWAVASAAVVLLIGVGVTELATVPVPAGASTGDAGMGGMAGAGYWSSVAGTAYHPTGRTRTYYLGADEVVWDYAPAGSNLITGKPFDAVADTYVKAGPGRIGSRYVKCLYRAYSDASFTRLAPRPAQEEYLGLLGPVIRAEVGDKIVVNFRNGCRIADSVHPHGVFYEKASEGAPYADNTSGADKADDAVPPGGRHTYTWLVPDRAGPGPHDGSSVMWMYHSHTDEVADTYAGLMGPMVITGHGQARPDGSPRDVDREVFELFSVMNENKSPYLDTNAQRFAQQPLADANDEGFQESNLMHSINGYVFGNQPMVTLAKGERVRWYVMGMGTETDLHTPHWHGNTVTVGGMRMDVVNLLPASMAVADMVPDNPGVWLFHCHVNDHITAGMVTRYQVVS